MIELSNGHKLEYVVASGALAFDGRGWFWERLLVWFGFVRPELFTIVLKSLTLEPRRGYLRWWKPWECVRTIFGGAVNKVGLTNPGFDWWLEEVAPTIDFKKQKIVLSLYGTPDEIVVMIRRSRHLAIVAIEYNVSCPNDEGPLKQEEVVVAGCQKISAAAGDIPLIAKLSAGQHYLVIEKGLRRYVEAISLNSVPWEMVFPGKRTPLWRLEKRVDGGGGGVSGKPAQKHNWQAVKELVEQGETPVIAPSIMEYEDLATVRALGAKAISFGAIHMASHPAWLKLWTWFTNPCKPTQFVLRDMKEKNP